MTRGERTRELFGQGLYCGESVLLALAEGLGRTDCGAPRMASGFCSGMARTGGVCGAVTGAVMGLSLAFGRDTADDDMALCYDRVQDFLERFQTRHGAVHCGELLGFELSAPEGPERFQAEGCKEKVCVPISAAAADLAWEVIGEAPMTAPGGGHDARA